MRSLYRTLSLRYLRQRWSRAALVIATIALGVATLVATRTLNESMTAAARGASTPLAESADLVVSNGEAGVNPELAAELTRVTGVRQVESMVDGRVRLPDLSTPEQPRNARLLGVIWKDKAADSNPWNVKIDWAVPPESMPAPENAVAQFLAPILKNMGAESLLPLLKKVGIRPVVVGKELADDLPHDTTAILVEELWPLVEELRGKLPAEIRATITRDRVEGLARKAIAELPPGMAFIRIQTVGQAKHLVLQVGTARAEGPLADLGKSVLIMNAPDAAELLHIPGLVSRLDLFLEPGTDREQVRQGVESLLANRARVQRPDTQEQSLQEVMRGIQIAFSLSGWGALIVGLFLVYNAMSVSVAERRHDIGILRSLGATRGQVGMLFAGEATLMGIAGAALGVPVGLTWAYLFLGPAQRILSEVLVPVEARHVSIFTADTLLSAAAGVVTAFLAAFVPALQAATDEPADVVRRVPPAPGFVYRLLHMGFSLLLIGLGAAGMVLHAQLPGRFGIYGGLMMLLLGLLLMTPVLVPLFTRALQPLVRNFAGIEARLACDNLARSPGRTGLVVAALAAGVTLVLQTAGVGRSNREPILQWIDQTFTADLVISMGDPIAGGGQNLPLQDEFGRRLKNEVPGIADVVPARFRRPNFRRPNFPPTIVWVTAVDAGKYYAANRHRPGTSEAELELYRRLRDEPGTAIVSINFAEQHAVQPGDTFNIDGPRGPVPLRVVGTVVDYSWQRGSLILDRQYYREQFGDDLVDVFDVYFPPAASEPEKEKLRRAVHDWSAKQAMFVMDKEQLIEKIAGVVNRLYSVAYVQQVVVGMVAALGVILSLLISVLQRRREMGLLRAVGATQRQVLVSVVAEATLIGVIGTIIGVAAGFPIEAYIVKVVIFHESGFVFPVLAPWSEAVWIIGGSIAIATLAGLGPAVRAVRMRIADAIAYE